VRKAEAAMARRLRAIEQWLMRELEAIPARARALNAAGEPRYEYLIDTERLRGIVARLRDLFGESGMAALMVDTALEGYEASTATAVTELARLTDDYTRSITAALGEAAYARRSALVGARIFEQMKGFEGEAANDLADTLMRAIQDGESPRTAARTIRDRFGVQRSRAERIARTEITGALRRGRRDEARDAQERMGIRTKMLWFSALSPTTRPSHAARHGNLYTEAEVEEFYSRDGNTIHCKCSQSIVLVDENDQPLTGQDLIEAERRRAGKG
jgi:SPP1 gp7 family putative phage head morphogenesis protein